MSIDQLIAFLTAFSKQNGVDEIKNSSDESEIKPVEMLTIKECTQCVTGLTDYTVRKLIKQGKVVSIHTGAGLRGKYLVNKQSLLDYVGGVHQ